MKQSLAQVFLERFQSGSDRGLRNIEPLRSAHETARFHNGQKSLKDGEVHRISAEDQFENIEYLLQYILFHKIDACLRSFPANGPGGDVKRVVQMKFQLALNLERNDDTVSMEAVRDHTLEMVQMADKNGLQRGVVG